MFYTTILKTNAVSGSPAEYQFSGSTYSNLTDDLIEHHIVNNIFILPIMTDIIPSNMDKITQFDLLSDESDDIKLPPIPEYRSITKEEAVDAVMVFVEYKKSIANKQPFFFNGHTYEADIQSIQATQNQCLTMNDDDSIPVTYGKWKTLGVNDNQPIYMDFTVHTFKLFAKALFDRGVFNFGIKEQHRQSLINLVNDTNSTVNDIFNYDYTINWV